MFGYVDAVQWRQKQTMLIKLHYPKDKKYKSINNREVFVNVDKIKFMQRKNMAADEALTEIWFDSKECIIVIETPDEINFMITHNLQDKTGGRSECIKFKDGFNEKEYEDFIKREG